MEFFKRKEKNICIPEGAKIETYVQTTPIHTHIKCITIFYSGGTLHVQTTSERAFIAFCYKQTRESSMWMACQRFVYSIYYRYCILLYQFAVCLNTPGHHANLLLCIGWHGDPLAYILAYHRCVDIPIKVPPPPSTLEWMRGPHAYSHFLGKGGIMGRSLGKIFRRNPGKGVFLVIANGN